MGYLLATRAGALHLVARNVLGAISWHQWSHRRTYGERRRRAKKEAETSGNIQLAVNSAYHCTTHCAGRDHW